QNFSDNVVDLMLEKLKRLPGNTLETLKQLACLGNSAELSLIAMVRSQSEDETSADLREAVRAGLAIRVNETYKFLHDRLEEVAYSLIPEASRAAVHLQIGRLMRTRLPP